VTSLIFLAAILATVIYLTITHTDVTEEEAHRKHGGGAPDGASG
jgi:hypothetical protein